MSEDNKVLLRRFLSEVWNQGRLNLIDELVDPAYVSHVAHIPQVSDREGLKQWVSAVRTAFPDIRFTIEDLLADDEKTTHRWSSVASHQGEFLGVSGTGKKVVCRGMSITRFSGGRIVEEWGEWDALRLLEQIGAVPTASEGG